MRVVDSSADGFNMITNNISFTSKSNIFKDFDVKLFKFCSYFGELVAHTIPDISFAHNS